MADAVKTKLLPCPFCGGESHVVKEAGGQAVNFDPVFKVQCKLHCCAESPWADNPDEPSAWWNCRRPWPSLQTADQAMWRLYAHAEAGKSMSEAMLAVLEEFVDGKPWTTGSALESRQ